MFRKGLLWGSLVVAVLASESSAGQLCNEIELKLTELGPGVEVVGTWKQRVYTDAIVTCIAKDELCLYKKTPRDKGVELIVESLVWSRSSGSSCDTIVSGKFRFDSVAARGQLAVVIAAALAGAAVLVVFFGCLAYFAHPDAFWGRILRKKRQRNQQDVSPPGSPTEMADRSNMTVTIGADRSAQ